MMLMLMNDVDELMYMNWIETRQNQKKIVGQLCGFLT